MLSNKINKALITSLIIVAALAAVSIVSAQTNENLAKLTIKTVHINVYGQDTTMLTGRANLQMVLDDLEIVLTPQDLVYQGLNGQKKYLSPSSYLYNEMSIVIERLEHQTITETVMLPYATKRTYDSSIPIGTVSTQQGRKGKAERTYSVITKNGAIIEKNLVAEDIIKQPINETVKVGQAKVYEDINLKGSSVLEVEATAYTYTGNPTATGVYPYKGVVAVDPRVIPLHSQVYIPGYGLAKALDTGGAIKGNKIDLFFEDRQAAIQFGRQNMTIYVLP